MNKRTHSKWWYLLSVILPAAMVYEFWFDPPTIFSATHAQVFLYCISVIFPLIILYMGVMSVKWLIIDRGKGDDK